jgi:preprotein translocase subunit SecA
MALAAPAGPPRRTGTAGRAQKRSLPMASSEIPLVGPIITRIFGTRNERMVKRYLQQVNAINALEPAARALTDAQLRAKITEFRERFRKGETILDILPDALAVARESMDRNVGIRSIFNPVHRDAFPKDRLPAPVRAAYDRVLAEMDAAEPLPPEGTLLGNTEPMPGWVWTDIPNEIYDAVRELFPQSRPPFRARPFDVQLIGAIVLYQGRIAEMRTGEGKTIVAPLACYLAAIEDMRVHVVTVNDYLVQRDRDWTFPFHRGLGLTVGAIHPQHMQGEDIKRLMYACDTVYGTTAEFGFDYLRDNMKRAVDQQVQRVREFAIVDEVDSILIDEARTPLIISGQAHDDQPRYDLANSLAIHLVGLNKPWDAADAKVEDCKRTIKGTEGDIRNAKDKEALPALQARLEQAKADLPRLEQERDRFTRYFEVERERRTVNATHAGVVEAQKKANIGSFYVGENTDLPHLLSQALRAHVIYELDTDYVILPTPDPQTGRSDPDVVIVDTNTGRPMYGRTWSDGLHQAIQAKEGLRIKAETQTVASVTIQNFFKMYQRLAGMTGTADTEAQEFHDIYKLDVVTIPTNLPVVRADFDDTVYLVAKDKWNAIVDEIKDFNDTGRPILVGTTSVEKSEMLARMLSSKHGVKHEVLNAKQHEREANIVEGAGQLGAVMIATNMAGRGTDIKLARVSRAQLLDHWLRRGIAPRELTVEDTDETLREKIYRKIAPKELGKTKREADETPFPELELQLLRHWAAQRTWTDPKALASMNADQLRTALDQQGRFALHRIRWVESVEELGGLHVIGTERHESRRIDNQLRGRSGRQGDRGSSRFFVSLEDDLMKLFAGPTTMNILSRLGMKEGDAIEHPMLSKAIVRAQRKVEERNFQIRKNILEYDEVMEHQRREFYSMRQRVLDGRDIRGLIFEYIEDAAVSAVEKYLDKDYPGERMATLASERVRVSIPPERLRGRDRDEVVAAVRRIARDEARHEIRITIGEYIPDAAQIEDIDTKGLIAWAASRFGVELDSKFVLESDTAAIAARLEEAAAAAIDAADLSGLDEFLTPNYGAAELCRWLRTATNLQFSVEDITSREKQEDIVAMVLERVRTAYDTREIEYPVDFMMELTTGLMQHNPQAAAGNLITWANTRFGLGWDESVIRTRLPQQIREDLVAASRAFVTSDRLSAAIDEALKCPHDEALEAHLRAKYNAPVPLWMRRLKGERRENAIRARVEQILRSELVWFEQTVLLQVIDPLWKDHLYAMDQLRDSINYRAYSQQDPRIEYKREGARLFREFEDRIRERVTEYVFRARVMPQVGPPPGQRPGAQRRPAPAGIAAAAAPAPRPAPAPAQAFGGGTITGPGLDRPPV